MTSLGLMYEVDPRHIIQGLAGLEDLWMSKGKDPRMIAAAVRGYALLMLTIYPDYLETNDLFAAQALSMLAYAKATRSVSVTREEALLAMVMGYKAHGKEILSQAEPPSSKTDQIIDAYLRKDVKALRSLRGSESRILSYYFLTRLYREIGLDREAEKEAMGLLDRFSNHYPSIVEMIYSCDFGLARKITASYPLDILARLEHQVMSENLMEKLVWIDRLKAVSGEEVQDARLSFSDLDTLLAKWHPFENDGRYTLFISEQK